MNILITGHKGLIGNKLYEYYKGQGHKVYGYDVKDRWTNVLKRQYDIIHHCASLCVIREVIANPMQMIHNIRVTYKVLELAKRDNPQQLYMYSSNRVTSNIENPYVTSKKFLENAVKGYAECYGINYLIIRPETIWGYKKDDVRVIPNWIEKCLKNENMIIYGDVNKELSPLYVDDFIVRLLSLGYNENKGKTITITGKVQLAYDVAQQIRKKLNSTSSIVFKEAETAQPQRCVSRQEDEIRINTNLNYDLERYDKYKKSKTSR